MFLLKGIGCYALSSHIQKDETPIAKHLKSIEIQHAESGMEGVDCIYVINLDSRPDKWNRVKKLFDERGLNVNRVSGVNGWQLSKETLQELCGSYPVRFANGHYGCMLSHLSVLKDAYARGFKQIWVAEDDVEFLEDVNQIPQLITKLDTIDPSWDIFYTDIKPRFIYNGEVIHVISTAYDPRPDEEVLEKEHYLVKTPVDENIMHIRQRTGTTSMVISRRGIKKILDYFTHVYIFTPLDIDIHFVPGIREYTPRRDLVSNWIESESDTISFIQSDNTFELALKAHEAKDFAKALTLFEKRAKEGGSDDEVFWSLYQKGVMEQLLDKDGETFCQSYYAAFNAYPLRAEPLYKLASYYRYNGNYLLGFILATKALKLEAPQTVLHRDQWIYEWGVKLEYTICAFHVDQHEKLKLVATELLADPNVPEYIKQIVEKNLSWVPEKEAPPQNVVVAQPVEQKNPDHGSFFSRLIQLFKEMSSPFTTPKKMGERL